MSRCRTVCRSTLCAFLFLGAIAFIAGSAHTAVQTVHRFQTVDRLNNAITRWNGFEDDTYANVKQTTLVANDVISTPPMSKRYEIIGDQQELHTNSFQSLTFNVQIPLDNNKDYQFIRLNRVLGDLPNTSSVTLEFASRRAWGVGSIYCECDTRDCECLTPGKECERDEMNAYVGKASCKRYEYCGECRNEEYATRICLAMGLGSEVSIDYEKAGCNGYPYSAGNMVEYTRKYKPSTVNVTVMDSKDPVFIAMEITDGTLELKSMQSKNSIIFALIAVLFLIGACYCCRTRKAPQPTGVEYIVFASPAHHPQNVNYGSVPYGKEQPALAV